MNYTIIITYFCIIISTTVKRSTKKLNIQYSLVIVTNATVRHTFCVPTTLFCYIGHSKQSFTLFVGDNQTRYTTISTAPTSRGCYVGINDNQKEKRTDGEVTGRMIS